MFNSTELLVNIIVIFVSLPLSRVNNLYIEESILLSNAYVETRSLKLWRNISEFVRYFPYNRWRQRINTISLKIDSARYNSAASKFKLLG